MAVATGTKILLNTVSLRWAPLVIWSHLDESPIESQAEMGHGAVSAGSTCTGQTVMKMWIYVTPNLSRHVGKWWYF